MCAFERDTAEFVWAGKPKGGCSTEIVSNYFAIVDEWLFYYDHSMTVYCMRGGRSSQECERAGDGWAKKFGSVCCGVAEHGERAWRERFRESGQCRTASRVNEPIRLVS